MQAFAVLFPEEKTIKLSESNSPHRPSDWRKSSNLWSADQTMSSIVYPCPTRTPSNDECGLPTLDVDTSEENKFDLFEIEKLLIKKENIYLSCIQNSLLYYVYKKGKRKAPQSGYLVRKSTDLDLY